MPQPEQRSFWMFALDALKDKTLIILCFAALVEIGTGVYKAAFAPQREPSAYADGITIILAILVIVFISSFNDYRKQAQFRELNDFSRSLTKVQVIRDKKTIQLPTSKVLVGDLCSITVGDILPADGILVQSFGLKCDESAITGEGRTINKDLKKDPFMLSGTKITDGLGRMVVIATGAESTNGRLLASLDVEEEQTPLQAKLGKLADRISLFGLLAASLLVAILLILYFVMKPEIPRSSVTIVSDIVGLFIVGITLVVVAVPEGLPLAVVLALAHATLRMLNDNNLVRHLKACETMGNATTVCSDKTGTLTQNKMSVIVGWVASHQIGELPKHFDAAAAAADMTISTNAAVTLLSRSASLLGREVRAAYESADSYSWAPFQLTQLESIPEVVLQHIARSINVNTTAEELVTGGENSPTSNSNDESRKRWWDRFIPKRNPKSDEEIPKKETVEFVGSKTEVALLEFTRRFFGRPYKEDRESSEIVSVLPFSSERKRMSTIIRIPGAQRDGVLESALFGSPPGLGNGERYWLFCKGASEVVLHSSSRYITKEGKVVPMTPEAREMYQDCINAMASTALRTICVAFKPLHGSVSSFGPQASRTMEKNQTERPSGSTPMITVSSDTILTSEPASSVVEQTKEIDDHDLIVAAILGIQDPIRAEVPAAVADCTRAGILVRMVTGDNTATAVSIARQAGIIPADAPEGAVMDGPTFRKLTQEQMDEILPNLRVLARSSPHDKQVLVNGLKRLGETVAVTGDGTNDAPALRTADVGFSMGIGGTEVAKEASDIVLLDDNFVSLAKAIVWGRSVYDSVRKFLQFQLTVNVVAVLLCMISGFVTATLTPSKNPQSVLTSIQLLWVNLIMDTLAALALATDPPTPELLDRPPARKTDPLISGHMWRLIIGQSFFQTVACVLLYLWYSGILKDGRVVGDYVHGVDSVTATVVFNCFVFCQLFNEFNCRVIGRDLNVFKNIFKNAYFITISLGTMLVQVLVVEVGGTAFQTTGLSGRDWGVCLGVALLSFPIAVIIRILPSFGMSSYHTTYKKGKEPFVVATVEDKEKQLFLDAEQSAPFSLWTDAVADEVASMRERDIMHERDYVLPMEVGFKDTVTLKDTRNPVTAK
ncbi:hypothetical protein HK405_005113, partial [Cladochytrium tenue]